MNLTELGLNKTTLVRLIFILIVILGIYSYETLPKYMDPDLNFNQAFITTIHKNLAAEDVEKFITTPIEDEIRDLSGIKKCFSTSSANLSTVIIEFDDHIKDMNPVIQDPFILTLCSAYGSETVPVSVVTYPVPDIIPKLMI